MGKKRKRKDSVLRETSVLLLLKLFKMCPLDRKKTIHTSNVSFALVKKKSIIFLNIEFI